MCGLFSCSAVVIFPRAPHPPGDPRPLGPKEAAKMESLAPTSSSTFPEGMEQTFSAAMPYTCLRTSARGAPMTAVTVAETRLRLLRGNHRK